MIFPRVPPQTIGLTAIAAAETAHAFSSFMPSAFTLKSFALKGSPEEIAEHLRDFRSGYLPAVLFGAALGGAISLLTHSPLPLAAASATAVGMIAGYERGMPPELRLNPFEALWGSTQAVWPQLAPPAPGALA